MTMSSTAPVVEGLRRYWGPVDGDRAVVPEAAGKWRSRCPECSGRLAVTEIGGDQIVHCVDRGCPEELVFDLLGLKRPPRRERPPLEAAAEDGNADVAAIKRGIFDDGQIVGQSGQELQEPVPGTNELLYRGSSVMIFGPRESGKSWVMLVLSIRAANAGEQVLYLDLENGEAIMREREEAILDANPEWPDPTQSGALTIISFPTLSRSWKPDAWAAALGDFSIVIFDPLHRMLEMHGLEEKDGFGSLVGTRIAPLRARGITVLMGDNVGHEHHDRPRGDSRKEDNVPQVYKCVTAEPFDQVRVGRVRLVCKRSRFGDVNREWEARMGGEVFELPTTVTESPKVRAAKRAAEREENFRRVVVAVLREEAPLGRDRLLGAVRERGVKVRQAKAVEWLSRAVADDACEVVHSEGRGYELGVDPKGVPEGCTRPLRRNDVGVGGYPRGTLPLPAPGALATGSRSRRLPDLQAPDRGGRMTRGVSSASDEPRGRGATVRHKLEDLLRARSDLTTAELARQVGTTLHTVRTELRALGATGRQPPQGGKKVWRLLAGPAADLGDLDLEFAERFLAQEAAARSPQRRPPRCRCERPLLFAGTHGERSCARCGREVS